MRGGLVVELVEEGMGGEEVKTKQIDDIFRKFGCEGNNITGWRLEVKEGVCWFGLGRRQ